MSEYLWHSGRLLPEWWEMWHHTWQGSHLQVCAVKTTLKGTVWPKMKFTNPYVIHLVLGVESVKTGGIEANTVRSMCQNRWWLASPLPRSRGSSSWRRAWSFSLPELCETSMTRMIQKTLYGTNCAYSITNTFLMLQVNHKIIFFDEIRGLCFSIIFRTSRTP